MNDVAIIGYGHVGKSIHQLFPEAIIYDPNIEEYKDNQDLINKKCKLAIICVWTGSNADGSCDISLVESSVKWLKTPLILIKSTVAPGTTDYLVKKYKKMICFSPEYVGEFTYWVPEAWTAKGWSYMVVGGDGETRKQILDFFIPILGPMKTYFQCSAIEAEIIKYTENSYLALKVTFAEEMYNICQKFGANWQVVREGWTLDPRVEKSHTAVFVKDRGYSQKCLPKDVSALIMAAEKKGYSANLLKAMTKVNKLVRTGNKKS